MKIGRYVLLIAMAFLLAAAAPVTRKDDLALQVLKELNLARTAPARYAEGLRVLRRHYRGSEFRVPGTRTWIVTREGVPAVDEAIRFLQRQKPLPPLGFSPPLAAAARELVQDEGKSGAIGHEGPKSGGMLDRIERHGTWRKRIGENISYGPPKARLIVVGFIVDDGVRDRGHRKNIFDPAFRTAGVACGPHARYSSMCVIDFAGGMK